MCINLNRYTHTYRCPNSLSLPKDRMQHTEMLSLDDFDHWVPKFCIFVVSGESTCIFLFWYLLVPEFPSLCENPQSLIPVGPILWGPYLHAQGFDPNRRWGWGEVGILTLCGSTMHGGKIGQSRPWLSKSTCWVNLQPISDSTKVEKKNQKNTDLFNQCWLMIHLISW